MIETVTVCLKHPEPPPKPPLPLVCGKIVFHETNPGAKRLGPAGGNRHVVTYPGGQVTQSDVAWQVLSACSLAAGLEWSPSICW